jgi:hypothetical protein
MFEGICLPDEFIYLLLLNQELVLPRLAIKSKVANLFFFQSGFLAFFDLATRHHLGE